MRKRAVKSNWILMFNMVTTLCVGTFAGTSLLVALLK